MGERIGRLARVCLLSAVLAGCGGGGGDPSPATASGVATIGANGGTMSGEGGAEVRFPAKALATDVTVRIAKDGTGAPPLPPSAVAAGAVYTITPHGGTFDELVEVSIPVERPDMAGDGQLLLVTAEPGDTQWRVLSGASYYDGKMRAPVMHFSFFQTIRLVNQIMPTLVTKIDGANNIGGAGTVRISALANLPFPTRPGHEDVPVNSLVAELSFPALITQSGTTTIRGVPPAAVTPSTTCRPVDHGHNAMSFRFTREGSQEFAPQVGHRAVVPREPWPRFPGDGGALTFTKNTTIRSGFTGFGAIHYYGNESPRIAGFHDANPPTQAQIDAVVASQNRDYPPPETLPIGNVYALPTAGDNAADNLYTWSGDVWWQPTQNGRVRIDAAIMTTCGLLLEAVPIAFRLAAPPGRNYLYVVPDGYSYWNEAAEGSDVSMYFGLRNSTGWAFNDTGVTYRVDHSPNPTTVDWQPIPTSAVTRESFQAFEHPGQSQTSLAYGVRVTLAAVQASQAGYYRVFACSADGCFDGRPAQLVVLRAVPSISAQPGGQTVQVGETASFTVATAGAPLPTLQWQKRSLAVALFGSQAWTNIDGATAATYTTPPLALADNATQYRVWASNALGGLASGIAMLTVVERFLPPVIDAQPGNLNVTVGGTAVFAATVSGAGPLSYQWRRNGSNITGANSPILTLSNVTALNDGRYDLVVSNRAGSATTDAGVLQVTLGTPVPLAPTIAASPASITVAEGNAANFAVAVTGTGPYTYLWMKNGVQAPIPNGDFPSFSIASVSAADAGTYTVRVTNNAGTVVSAAATLTVSPGNGVTLAPTITTAPAALAVLQGGGATFAVAAAGTAPFSYQWRRNGADIAGATGAVLHIAAVTALDAGQYAVEVRNAAGAASSGGVPLIVIGAPVITQQPAAASATAGNTATLSVAASGEGVLYQWTRNQVAITGATSPSYTTPALTLADNGAVYGVIAYNGAGLVFSQGAALTVTAAPVALQWQGTLALRDSDGFSAMRPMMAAGAAGQFVAAWLDTNAAGAKELRASRYRPGEGWSPVDTVAIVTSNSGATMSHAVAMDPAGNAVVVFTSQSNSRQSIWASRQGEIGGWSTPDLLESQDDGQAELPALAIDAQGTATAVWQQNDTIFFPNMLATRRIVASRFVVGQGWSAPVDIDFATGGNGTGLNIHVGASPAGDVVAAWTTSDAVGQVAAANVLRRGVGWIGAQRLVADNTSTTASVVGGAAINDAGLALVTFRRLPSTVSNVFAARYVPATGWASPELLGTNGDAPTVVLGPDGMATVAWENSPSGNQILVARASAAGVWSAPQAAGAGFGPQLGRDADGNVTVAWLSNPGVRTVMAARWPAGGALTAAALIESAPAVLTGWLPGGLAVSANGHAAAVWIEGASEAVPWANLFR